MRFQDKYIVGMCILLSGQVFAMNRVEQLSIQNPDATPFEILKQSYEESTDQILFEDIGVARQTCVAAQSQDKTPADLDGAFVHFKSYKKVLGTPERGPLFPATLSHILVKDGVAILAAPFSQDTRDLLFDNLNTNVSATQITTTVTDFRESPYVMSVRKNGNLVLFFQRIGAGTQSERSYYGYCWIQKLIYRVP